MPVKKKFTQLLIVMVETFRISARELTFFENIHLPPCVTRQLPCVMCHMSRGMCHMSHVMCQMFLFYKVVELNQSINFIPEVHKKIK